jgi:acetyl esterase/lipase
MKMNGKTREIDMTCAITYASDGETALLGDLYRPADRGPHPVIVAVHGGGWDQGSRDCYRDWGIYLAERGFALFATDRRHFKPDEPAFPGVIEDLQAAVRYVRSHAAELNVDPQRIAVMGDSSGGYIAALMGLVGDMPVGEKAGGAAPAVSCAVKAVIAVYGVFDLAAEWNFEQRARPFDRVTEKLLGVPLIDDRKRYFDASPVAYVTRNRNHLAFFLAWGTADDVVSEELHSRPFAQMLGQANFIVHTAILPYAQHYWASEPLHGEASHASLMAPRLVRFLGQYL